MDKACKRVLDFIAVIQNDSLSKLVLKLIQGYLNLLIYALKLERQFLSRYGLKDCEEDEPKSQVDQILSIVSNLIFSYGQSSIDQIILLLLDLIVQNPRISLELISILSKIATSFKIDPGLIFLKIQSPQN